MLSAPMVYKQVIFLDFMLTKRGIKENYDKSHAIIDVRIPFNVKQVQQLTWRLTTISRFLFYSGDKVFHFFVTLKKKENFEWTRKWEGSFLNLKAFPESPPILTCPIVCTPLYPYVSCYRPNNEFTARPRDR